MELSPTAELILDRLSGLPALGPEPDVEALSDMELGRLAPAIWRQVQRTPLVHQFREALRQREPVYRVEDAREALDTLARDDFLFQLPAGARVPPTLTRAVARGLERLFLRPEPLPLSDFTARILGGEATADHAAALIWWLEGVGPARPERQGRAWRWVDVGERPVEPGPGVRLWHPLMPGAQARQWQADIVRRGVSQPFNQAFRENYTPDAIADFLGVPVSARTLVGLARAQGWSMHHASQLVRRVGPYRVLLTTEGRLYPGVAQVPTALERVELFLGSGQVRLDPSRDHAQGLSECLRRVDLLVSVAAFSLEEGAGNLPLARNRQAVLSGLLAAREGDAVARVDGHWVRHGDVAIHLATGRALRCGRELPPPGRDGGVVVLPYPDPVLQRIVAWIAALDAE